jgi:hypothetical protein
LIKIQSDTFAASNCLISPDGKSIVIDSDKNPSFSYILTQQADALEAWHNLTTEQKLILEKLIDQFTKKPGIQSAPDAEPTAIYGKMFKDFLKLPAPIKRCLKAYYNLVDGDLGDVGGQGCVIL